VLIPLLLRDIRSWDGKPRADASVLFQALRKPVAVYVAADLHSISKVTLETHPM
jgi:hypothetical protein